MVLSLFYHCQSPVAVEWKKARRRGARHGHTPAPRRTSFRVQLRFSPFHLGGKVIPNIDVSWPDAVGLGVKVETLTLVQADLGGWEWRVDLSGWGPTFEELVGYEVESLSFSAQEERQDVLAPPAEVVDGVPALENGVDAPPAYVYDAPVRGLVAGGNLIPVCAGVPTLASAVALGNAADAPTLESAASPACDGAPLPVTSAVFLPLAAYELVPCLELFAGVRPPAPVEDATVVLAEGVVRDADVVVGYGCDDPHGTADEGVAEDREMQEF